MHEASLTNDLVRKMVEIAKSENAGRVVRAEVWLGALSHMSPDHFKEHFKVSSVGSLAEGAELVIETSDDIAHSEAQSILLRRIETED